MAVRPGVPAPTMFEAAPRRLGAVEAFWRAHAIWLAPATALFAWWSVLAVALPYGADESVYRIVAAGILDGRWPYRDLFDNKQPLLYVWYMPAGLGASVEAQRMFAGLLAAASLAPMYIVARRMLTRRQTAFALAAYAGLLANPFMGPGTNADSYTLLPIVAAAAAPAPLLAGLLLGVAVATKFTAVLFLPVLALIWRRRAPMVLLGATIVPLAAVVAFMPVWRDFWDTSVAFNLSFGSGAPGGGIAGRLALDPWAMLGALPFWLAALAGALIWRNRIAQAWALCALLSVKATGLEYAHYYVLLAPPAALFAGVAFERFARVLTAREPRAASFRAGALTIGVLAAIPAIALAAVAVVHGLGQRGAYDGLVAATRRSDGELYVLGDRPQIYVIAGRTPERRFFFSVPFSVRDEWAMETRSSLIACPPAVLVVPPGDKFTPPWAPDIERLYADRVEFGQGIVYTSPRTTC